MDPAVSRAGIISVTMSVPLPHSMNTVVRLSLLLFNLSNHDSSNQLKAIAYPDSIQHPFTIAVISPDITQPPDEPIDMRIQRISDEDWYRVGKVDRFTMGD